jgi:hypothetical protein
VDRWAALLRREAQDLKMLEAPVIPALIQYSAGTSTQITRVRKRFEGLRQV